jgi:RNA polymerase sigma-70 factor (ECF subfamily)
VQKVNSEDSLLIEKSQKGDRSAFNQLISKHTERAYQFAHRLTRSPEEASDIVAEAFVRVFRALDRFKGDSSFTTWLYRIETNCFLDMKKKVRSRPVASLDAFLQTEDGEMSFQVEDLAPSPYEHTEHNERMTAMEQAVAELAEYQRAMIVMYHGEMKSYEEMAEILQVPIGTVKSRLNRARLALRSRLSDNSIFTEELRYA